jgi:hypothetical protein
LDDKITRLGVEGRCGTGRQAFVQCMLVPANHLPLTLPASLSVLLPARWLAPNDRSYVPEVSQEAGILGPGHQLVDAYERRDSHDRHVYWPSPYPC